MVGGGCVCKHCKRIKENFNLPSFRWALYNTFFLLFRLKHKHLLSGEIESIIKTGEVQGERYRSSNDKPFFDGWALVGIVCFIDSRLQRQTNLMKVLTTTQWNPALQTITTTITTTTKTYISILLQVPCYVIPSFTNVYYYRLHKWYMPCKSTYCCWKCLDGTRPASFIPSSPARQA